MKNLRRRLQKLSTRLISLLVLVPLLACVALNARPSFDGPWMILTGGGAVILTVLILAPKLLPIAGAPAEYKGAYRIFFKYLIGRRPPLTLVRDGKVVPTAGAAPAKGKPNGKANEEDESSARGVIVTDSTSVVALRTATGISRIVGPGTERDQLPSGVIFTELDEVIDTIVDLRPQVRQTPSFQATTHDGLTVEAKVIAFLSLQRVKSRRMRDLAKEPVRWPPPFTWHASPIWQALNTRRIHQRKDDKPQRTDWIDSVLAMAVPQMRQIIARYTVDQLTAPLDAPKHLRFGIRDELVRYVRQRLEPPPDDPDNLNRPTGIEVRFMAVPLMWPPKEILLQRIESWKNEWHKRIDEIDGRAEAEAIRTRELTRAQVQGEMTARINDALREARASGTGNYDLITLRFLEAMEKMAKDPTTRALLTLDSLKILKQLREMLAPDPDGGDA
jgi:regulator of protease activity HflC (stomatin/prohibitin superfamily)